MNPLVRSYLSYARGEKSVSPWLVLKPIGCVSAAVIGLRGWLYDHGLFASEESPAAVVSVGNITTGGTNKTPFVEFLVSRLRDFGLRPGIVSRGYGGRARGPIVVLNGKGDRVVVGDEPLLLSKHLPEVPVAVSSDRLADIRALDNYQVDIVVADDAFQHRKLARSLDIVMIDALCPFGNDATIPGGILREPLSALSRAHAVVITRSDQASPDALRQLKAQITRWAAEDHVFFSRLGKPQWLRWENGAAAECGVSCENLKFAVFSGIGNPKSFTGTVKASGAHVVCHTEFNDHHQYHPADLRKIEEKAKALGANALCCTEKDVYNLPCGYKPSLPLFVPRIRSALEDEERFWRVFAAALRPRLVVASNGHGEDAIGAALAQRLQRRFPAAQVCAFPLVGKGEQYGRIGAEILAPLADSPTGGIIKYHLKDLCAEVKAGLFGHIGRQLGAWKSVRSHCCSVICLGDAYLLCHTIWGQGKKVVMVATAKTKYISGHWRLESFLYRNGAHKVWTRDAATATELRDRGVDAVFAGNPIMDLQCGESERQNLWEDGRRILVLPGSRKRAYRDLELIFGALTKIAASVKISAIMVLAPGIDPKKTAQAARGWSVEGDRIVRDNAAVRLFCGDVSAVAQGAELLLGLAGTANQVCAGMGIPVLSIKEKGKFVQKKLLGDAELLTEPDVDVLAGEALRLLDSPCELERMGEAGRQRLGSPGALDSVAAFAEKELGWGDKCRLYLKLRAAVENMGKAKVLPE